MPFIFKGGTCLLLLSKHPMRLSTDIDIIVAPDTDVEKPCFVGVFRDDFIFRASEAEHDTVAAL